jgi:cytochrome c-type biogenesis protein
MAPCVRGEGSRLDSSGVPLLAALGAGVLSFISPCVLPLVPVYISYLSGTAAGQQDAGGRAATVWQALLFVLGFSAVFIILGASAGLLGSGLNQYLPVLRQVGGILLVVFGLHVMGAITIPLLYREKRLDYQPVTRGGGTSFVVGMVFALGWTPCVGPILAAILLLASDSATVGQGALLLAVYSMGLGLPFLATALALGSVTRVLKRLNRYYHAIEVVSGLFLIVLGVLLFTNTLQRLAGLFNWVPPL